MELIKINKMPNRKLFDWYYGSYSTDGIYPPVLAQIDNSFYQLNKFNEGFNEFLYIGKVKPLDALINSINLKNNINVVEISNIIQIADLLNININEIEFFNRNNIKGNKLIEALRRVKFYPEAIKEYIVSKDISFKLVILLSQHLNKIGKILERYIKECFPTISDFRKYLYILIDYKDYINTDDFDFKDINNVISERNKHICGFYSKFEELKKNLVPVNVENIDNFETAQLIFSFAILNFIDYKNILTKLKEKKELVYDFYDYMNKNDIY